MSEQQEQAITCTRQKPYKVHEVRSMLGRLCGRPAVTTGKRKAHLLSAPGR